MNREQILAMGPGIELDSLIAEQVMGWKVDGSTVNKKGYIGYMVEFQPSRDMAAAILVLEKFDSYQCTKAQNVGVAKDRMYRVIVKANKHVARAETLPLAASRAVLIATLDPRGGDAE